MLASGCELSLASPRVMEGVKMDEEIQLEGPNKNIIVIEKIDPGDVTVGPEQNK